MNLTELKKLAEGATKGVTMERVAHDDGLFSYEFGTPGLLWAIYEMNYDWEEGNNKMQAKFDAEFYAAANPATILKLIEAVEVMREALTDLERGYGQPLNPGMTATSIGAFCRKAEITLARVAQLLEEKE